MKYKIERDRHNKNMITIHLDIDLMNFRSKLNKQLQRGSDNDFWNDEENFAPIFLNRIRMIKGVLNACFDKYSIDVTKGELFSWSGIIHQIMSDLQITLNHGSRARRANSHSLKLFQRRNGLKKVGHRNIKDVKV